MVFGLGWRGGWCAVNGLVCLPPWFFPRRFGETPGQSICSPDGSTCAEGYRGFLCRGILSGQCGTTRMVWHVDGGNPFHGRAVLGKSIAAMSWGPVIRLCSRSSHTMRAAGKQPHKGLSHTPPARLCVVRAREVAAVPTTIGAASGGPGWPGDFPIFRSVSCTARQPSGNCDGGCL